VQLGFALSRSALQITVHSFNRIVPPHLARKNLLFLFSPLAVIPDNLPYLLRLRSSFRVPIAFPPQLFPFSKHLDLFPARFFSPSKVTRILHPPSSYLAHAQAASLTSCSVCNVDWFPNTPHFLYETPPCCPFALTIFFAHLSFSLQTFLSALCFRLFRHTVFLL